MPPPRVPGHTVASIVHAPAGVGAGAGAGAGVLPFISFEDFVPLQRRIARRGSTASLSSLHPHVTESMQSLLDRVNRAIAERRWHVLNVETLFVPDTTAVALGELTAEDQLAPRLQVLRVWYRVAVFDDAVLPDPYKSPFDSQALQPAAERTML
eukprot:m.161743 g.161743  ORF g.161743 m.161743 type:complete len:154 (+) comp15198_c4_seq7:2812-3273(+)